MLGVAAGGVGGHPVTLGFQFLPVKFSIKSKAGSGIAVNDAARDIQLFGYQRVGAEPRVVNVPASLVRCD